MIFRIVKIFLYSIGTATVILPLLIVVTNLRFTWLFVLGFLVPLAIPLPLLIWKHDLLRIKVIDCVIVVVLAITGIYAALMILLVPAGFIY